MPGVAYSAIRPLVFSARAHRFRSIFGSTGSSAFPSDIPRTVCTLNSSTTRRIACDLNPTIHFTQRDVERLPLLQVDRLVAEIFSTIETSRSASTSPTASPRSSSSSPAPPPGATPRTGPRPPSTAPKARRSRPTSRTTIPSPRPTTSASPSASPSAASARSGEGILDPSAPTSRTPCPPASSSSTAPSTPTIAATVSATRPPSRSTPPGPSTARPSTSRDLRDWLRLEVLQRRPQAACTRTGPSTGRSRRAKKTFVAWVNIHRWTRRRCGSCSPTTSHRRPSPPRRRADRPARRPRRRRQEEPPAPPRSATTRCSKWRDELDDFIAMVEPVRREGPAAHRPEVHRTARSTPATRPDLDDGVMINSAALWPLLDPQWKDPKKWWKELAAAKGKKDYDWSHLAMRYWPTRVDAKCQEDPSLGVAHGCFWRYHPARAWAWELRLQDEIGPDFQHRRAALRPARPRPRPDRRRRRRRPPRRLPLGQTRRGPGRGRERSPPPPAFIEEELRQEGRVQESVLRQPLVEAGRRRDARRRPHRRAPPPRARPLDSSPGRVLGARAEDQREAGRRVASPRPRRARSPRRLRRRQPEGREGPRAPFARADLAPARARGRARERRGARCVRNSWTIRVSPSGERRIPCSIGGSHAGEAPSAHPDRRPTCRSIADRALEGRSTRGSTGLSAPRSAPHLRVDRGSRAQNGNHTRVDRRSRAPRRTDLRVDRAIIASGTDLQPCTLRRTRRTRALAAAVELHAPDGDGADRARARGEQGGVMTEGQGDRRSQRVGAPMSTRLGAADRALEGARRRRAAERIDSARQGMDEGQLLGLGFRDPAAREPVAPREPSIRASLGQSTATRLRSGTGARRPLS